MSLIPDWTQGRVLGLDEAWVQANLKYALGRLQSFHSNQKPFSPELIQLLSTIQGYTRDLCTEHGANGSPLPEDHPKQKILQAFRERIPQITSDTSSSWGLKERNMFRETALLDALDGVALVWFGGIPTLYDKTIGKYLQLESPDYVKNNLPNGIVDIYNIENVLQIYGQSEWLRVPSFWDLECFLVWKPYEYFHLFHDLLFSDLETNRFGDYILWLSDSQDVPWVIVPQHEYPRWIFEWTVRQNLLLKRGWFDATIGEWERITKIKLNVSSHFSDWRRISGEQYQSKATENIPSQIFNAGAIRLFVSEIGWVTDVI